MNNEGVKQNTTENSSGISTEHSTDSLNQPHSNIQNQSMHTLEGDLFAAVKDDNYGHNVVKIVTSDQNTNKFSTTDKKPSINIIRNTIYIVLGMIVLIGGGFVMFKYLNNTDKTVEVDTLVDATSTDSTATSTTTTTSNLLKSNEIINPEIFQKLSISQLNKNSIVREINKTKTVLVGQKVKAYTNIGLTLDTDVQTFFSKLRYSGGENLLRSFADDYMFGLFVNSSRDFDSYIIIKTNSYDLTFAGLLEWEPYMPSDLKDIFIKEKSELSTNASSTNPASSSVSTSSKAYSGNQNIFTDQVIKNIDTRVYEDKALNLKIIYGVINKEYLIITNGEEAFIDIRNKLLSKNILR